MNQTELIKGIAEATGLTLKDAKGSLDAFMGIVTSSLKKGEAVQLPGFGTFKVQKREARTGRNPRNGEALKIPATTLAKFVTGSRLAEAVK